MARVLEARLRSLERSSPAIHLPLKVIFVAEGEDTAAADAMRVAAPGRVLVVRFVDPKNESPVHRMRAMDSLG